MLILACAVAGCSSYQSPASPAAPTQAAGDSANAVVMKNFAFSPATITVNTGTTVTWTNDDGATHTVVSDSGAFASEPLGPGSSFRFTFNTAGTYTYHCSIHTSMKGTVVVQP